MRVSGRYSKSTAKSSQITAKEMREIAGLERAAGRAKRCGRYADAAESAALARTESSSNAATTNIIAKLNARRRTVCQNPQLFGRNLPHGVERELKRAKEA